MSPAERKIERLRAALSHREGDRVPISDFFWTGFMKRCQAKYGNGFDPYRHFDLDYVNINPNMDPKIQPFEVVEQKGEDIVVKTGFGATIRRRGDLPMPHFEDFSVKRPEEMEDFQFDPPDDPRRFFAGGDDQLNCVGDALARNLPSWDERLKSYEGDFALFGGVCEPYEMLWRIIGSQNALYWLATDADRVQAFIDRIGKFMLEFLRAQIAAGKGRLSGMYIWGDVAYVKGMFFGAPRWRSLLKPHVKALIDLCHEHGLMVVYHGCGDARAIYEDFVEIGLDGYNPLEAKARLDAVELKKQYGGRLAFVGNLDVRELESGDPGRIEREVRYKLQAAQGGGWICQSDHSVTSRVAPESYELVVQTLRRWGDYPLRGNVPS
jgi:uroporphyrinogen decarboxylase